MKMVWEPTTCCGCMSPRVGTLVLGWLCLIGSLLEVLSSLKYVVYSYSDWEQICDEEIRKNGDDVSVDTCVHLALTIIIIIAVSSAIGVIISALLLVGVMKNKPVLMLPFMICQVIGITLGCIVGLIVFGFFLYLGAHGIAFIFVIIFGLIMLLEVYFFLVIRVCYNEVKQHSKRTANGIPYVEQVSFPYKN